MKHLTCCCLLVILVSVVFVRCGSEKKEYVDTVYNRDSIPSMITDSVTELISDSGLIRYKMIAAKWLVFDNARDPYWYFPERIYLEQFDTLFQIQATLEADTAWNFTQRKMWRLKGNVFIRNRQDETFKSEELFWNEKTGKVFSDKYIEINKPDELLLRGHGFESNQQMTQYRIFRPFNSEIFITESEDNVSDSIGGRGGTTPPLREDSVFRMNDNN